MFPLSITLPKTTYCINPNQNLRSTDSITMTPAISNKPQLQITIPNEDPEKTDIGTVKMVEANYEVIVTK